MKDYIIVIPGLFPRKKFFNKLVNHGQKESIQGEIFWVNWYSRKDDYSTIQEKLLKRIDELREKNFRIFLIGTSAGGTLALNAFTKRNKEIHRMVFICSPMSDENSLTLTIGKKISPLFRESLETCKKQKDLINELERKNILVVIPHRDELVPVPAMRIDGAKTLKINTNEHFMSINYAMTERFNEIYSHLTS
jgi:pimeloyl-ACP methyl ester carboxylesterase